MIGLVPGLPSPRVDPDVIFFVFLPPLLYAAAITVSAAELKDNWRPIGLLAVGLVLVTIAAVAAVANALLGIPWAAAFVLGAILGPTDPVSAAAVLDRLGVTGSTKTILRGESLINDASGLTVYRIAIAAVGGTAGSAFDVSLELAKIVAGGIAIGLAAGWLFAHLRRLVTDPSLDVALSVLTPFVAYVPAEELHVSGVLATVVAGLYIGARSLDIIEPGTRLRTLAFWDSTAFLLDGLLFVLIGLQVPTIVERIEEYDLATLCVYALVITAVVMAVRVLWMTVVPALLHSETTMPERVVIAWSGMRGGVSLAAALAITIDFPERDLVIFVAYAVIVLTLVLPGSRSRRCCASSGWRRARTTGAPTPRRASESPRPHSSASRRPATTSPSTSCSGCVTATARGSSAWSSASRAITTSTAGPTWRSPASCSRR